MTSKEEFQALSDGLNNNLLFHEGVVGLYMALSSGDDVPLAEKLLGLTTRFFAVTSFVASVGTGYLMEGRYGATKGAISSTAGLLTGLAVGAFTSSVVTGPVGTIIGLGLGMYAGSSAGNLTQSFIDSLYKEGIGGQALQPAGRSSARLPGEYGLVPRGYETNALDVLGEMGVFQSFQPSADLQWSISTNPVDNRSVGSPITTSDLESSPAAIVDVITSPELAVTVEPISPIDPITPINIDAITPITLLPIAMPIGVVAVDLRPVAPPEPPAPRPEVVRPDNATGSPLSGGGGLGGAASRGEDRNDRGSNSYGAGNYDRDTSSSGATRNAGSSNNSSSTGGKSSSGATGRNSSGGGFSASGNGSSGAGTGSSVSGRSSSGSGATVGRDPGGRSFEHESKRDGTSASGKGSASSGTGSKGSGRAGFAGVPVLLDLIGNGLDIDPLSSSSKFVETNGDGYQRRTAWAGDGNGVLVIDLGGDGRISEEKEFAFAQWDSGASGDLAALKSVFDTNQNGKLDAGDARWNEFKVMVGEQLVSLASLGIESIDLTPTGAGRVFSDGSAITGTTTFTRTDGTKGDVGDAVLAMDGTSYVVKRNSVINADGSTTTEISGFNSAGALSFRELIAVSADKATTTTRFDDDGNGTYDRQQTVTLTVGVDGSRTKTVSNFAADGSLADRTSTVTTGDKSAVTTLLDADGDGLADERQLFVRSADGSTSTTVEALNANGMVTRRVVISATADGLSKTTKTDVTGRGVFDVERTEATVVNVDGSRTRTITETSANGTLLSRTAETISANSRAQTINLDHAGSGRFDELQTVTTEVGPDGAATTTGIVRNEDGTLRSKTVTTISANGLDKTAATDLTGDGVTDRLSSNKVTVGADGTWTETIEQRSGSGALLEKRVTIKNADRSNTSISIDKNGDGYADESASVVVAADRSTTTTIKVLSRNGKAVTTTSSAVSADGLTQTIRRDLDGDGTFDVTVADTTVVNADGGRTQTVIETSASGALLERTVKTVYADSLTTVTGTDVDADGMIDTTVTDFTQLNADGSRTQWLTQRSGSGALLGVSQTQISADRKTVVLTEDANGDGATDRRVTTVVGADGGKTETIVAMTADGTTISRQTTIISADGLTTTIETDGDGNGTVDAQTTDRTVINANGSRTRTVYERAGDATLLTSTTVSTSGNGLAVETAIDRNGDGVADDGMSDITVLNQDGSKTRTVTGSADGTVRTTVSANGLSKTTAVDRNGDGTFERSTTEISQLLADGSISTTNTVTSGTGTLLSKATTSTAADRMSSSTEMDLDGDGLNDMVRTSAVDAAGLTTTTDSIYAKSGGQSVLVSRAVTTVTANGLTTRQSLDYDGNGTVDRTTETVKTLNQDGSVTEITSEFNGAGGRTAQTIKVASANGLVKTTQWLTDGVAVNRRATETRVLNADGSQLTTVEERSGSGSLLSRSTTSVNSTHSFTFAQRDTDGDGQTNLWETTTINDGGQTTDTRNYANSGLLISRTFVYSDATGLYRKEFDDVNGDWSTDFTTETHTMLHNNGGNTVTISKASANDALLSRNMVTTSGNGLSVVQETDANGDGVVDKTVTTTTVIENDGSKAVTQSMMAGTSLASRSTVTTSANGLVSRTVSDLNGDGVTDNTMRQWKALNADGSTYSAAESYAADGRLVARSETNTSANGRHVTQGIDQDGNGVSDRWIEDKITANGEQVRSVTEQNVSGAALSASVTIVSANRLMTTKTFDFNGDNTPDLHRRVETSIGADGVTTTLHSEFSGNWILKDGIRTTFSANGLTKQIVYVDSNYATLRAYTDATTHHQDGSTQNDRLFFNADWSRESYVGTWTSADKRIINVTKDIDGDLVADQFTLTQLYNDGTTHQVLNDFRSDGQTIARQAVIDTSGNGLSKSYTYDSDGNGVSDVQVTKNTVIGVDGGRTVTTDYRSNENGSLVLKGREVATVSGDGLTENVQWDDTGTGSFNGRKSRVTTLNADGSRTTTEQQFASGQSVGRLTTTVSANSLVTSKQLDVDGNGTVDQTQIDTTLLNADGTSTRTVASLGTDSAVLSTMTISSSADGRTVTVHDVSGIDGIASRSTTSVTRERADGGSVKVYSVRNGSDQLLERVTTTVSDDNRLIQIERDTNGDGQVEQMEQVVTTVDGRKLITVTNFNNGTMTGRITTTQAANGLSSVTEVDRNGDGNSDTRKVQTNAFYADGSREIVIADTDLKSGNLRSRITKATSADGRTHVETTDVDGDGVIDRTVRETVLASGIRQTSETNNARARKSDQKFNGETYWNDKVPAASETTTSADGRVKTTSVDIDGDGRFEVSMVARTRIDGSTVTTVTETNSDGSVKARGVFEVSHDGVANVFKRDGNNDGFYELVETTTKLSSGAVERTAVTRDIGGTVAKTAQIKVDGFGNVVHIKTVDGAGRTLDEQIRAPNGTSTRTSYVAATGAVLATEVLDDLNIIRSSVLYDPLNQQTWSRVEQTYDIAGIKILEKQFLDDGTRTELHYRASDGQINRSQTFAANGALTSETLYDTQGKRTSTVLYDPLSQNAWSRVEQTFDVAGIKTAEKQFLDDGTRTELLYRSPGGQIQQSQTFAGNGALTSVTLYDTQGKRTSAVLHDPLDQNAWLRVEQTFDAADVKTLEKQFLDAGGRSESYYRSPGGQVYEVHNFAADGALLSKTFHDAAGKKTNATIFDAHNQNVWSRVEQTFDAASVKTVEKQFLDNGGRSDFYYRSPGGQVHEVQSFAADGALLSKTFYDTAGKRTSAVVYDPYNQSGWSRVEQTFDAGGARTLEKQFNDNGTRTDLYYHASGQLFEAQVFSAAGVLTSKTEYDAFANQAWSRREHLIDAQGRTTQSSTFNDNGTRTASLFDASNAQSWSTNTSFYNADGQVYYVDQANDNGTFNTITYDVPNSQGWSRYEQHKDSSGRVLVQMNFNDNGTRSTYTYDPANAQTWSLNQQNYNAAGQLQTVDQTNDDGTHNTIHYDVDNNQGWSRYEQHIDSSGRVLSQVNFNDNGTRHAYTFDPTNTQSWMKITQVYNAAGALEWQANEFDNGTTQTTTYNVYNNQPWSKFIEEKNAAGTVTTTAAYQSDNSHFDRFWDVSNSQPWSSLEQYINAAGQVTAQFQKRDDGSVEETRYNGQATSRQIATFDANYYLAMNPDIAAGWHAPAIEHYNQFGWKEGRRPNAYFDGNFYLQQNADIKNGGLNPFEHWRGWGYVEGRVPHAGYQRFDARAQSDLAGLNEPLFAGLQVDRIRTMRDYARQLLAQDRRGPEYRLPSGVKAAALTAANEDDRTVLAMWPRYVTNRFGMLSNKPVLLDLDGDGHIDLRMFSPAEFEAGNGPRFDWDGDGIADGTAWAGPSDGWLAIDLDAAGGAGPDGLINQAKELAFTMWKTPEELAGEQADISDLEALRLVFDTNQNNLLDAGDARWSEFRVWRDANQNGVTDVGELRTLEDADISLIELVPSSQGAQQFADGSQISGTSRYIKGDGTSHALVGDASITYRPGEVGAPA
ncbi:UNVERIFIED_ORG: hypothetical protein J2W85_005085 [Ensifer adhaerens]|nr:hypothetical protein [Ensifer adhaerens]